MSKGDYFRRNIRPYNRNHPQTNYCRGRGRHKKPRDIIRAELRKREYSGPSLKELNQAIKLFDGDFMDAMALLGSMAHSKRKRNIEKKLKDEINR